MVSNSSAVEQVAKVRGFEDEDAVRREQPPNASDDVVEIRHVRHHVVRYHEARAIPSCTRLVGEARVRRTRMRVGTPPARPPRQAASSRIDAKHADIPSCCEVLQEIAVVAADLDDERLGGEARRVDQRRRHAPRMPKHRVGPG